MGSRCSSLRRAFSPLPCVPGAFPLSVLRWTGELDASRSDPDPACSAPDPACSTPDPACSDPRASSRRPSPSLDVEVVLRTPSLSHASSSTPLAFHLFASCSARGGEKWFSVSGGVGAVTTSVSVTNANPVETLSFALPTLAPLCSFAFSPSLWVGEDDGWGRLRGGSATRKHCTRSPQGKSSNFKYTIYTHSTCN
jgi:hypothetical protein